MFQQLAPVATAEGLLCAKVAYRQQSLVATLVVVAPPPLPKIIYDYVNSPTGPQRDQRISQSPRDRQEASMPRTKPRCV